MNINEREKMTYKLMRDDIADMRQEIFDHTYTFLNHVLKKGWKGYDDMTDDELKAEFEVRFYDELHPYPTCPKRIWIKEG